MRITHPADWNEARKSILKEAVEKAGMPTYELVTEPVAAAVRISLSSTQPGQTIAGPTTSAEGPSTLQYFSGPKKGSRSPDRLQVAIPSVERTSTSVSSTTSARSFPTSTPRTGQSSQPP